MIKSLLFVLLAFSSNAFAAVTLQLIPASPTLITADSKIDIGNGTFQDVKAPWFEGNLMIMNSGTDIVSLTSQTMTISNAAGFSNTVTQPMNFAVAAGTGVQLRGLYSLVGLADPETYQYQMTVNGTNGDGTPFSTSATFTLSK